MIALPFVSTSLRRRPVVLAAALRGFGSMTTMLDKPGDLVDLRRARSRRR